MQFWNDINWCSSGEKPLHRHAITVTDKLFVVPLHKAPQTALESRLEELVQRVSPCPVYLQFAEEVKVRPMAGCKLLDLLSRPWLLFAELVAGEGKDAQATGLGEAGVQVSQLRVVPLSQASLRRHVDYQRHMTSVLVERDKVPINVLGFKLKDGLSSLDLFINLSSVGQHLQPRPL